ncbi:MAG TPA: hypothetical protein H9790_10060 [Candidatus Agathobaculum intestinipullorum]|nr:hypothetical protein [Candidatus Agathobaculum intestinipullorum]
MRDELKTALDKVTADDALRQSTRAFLARQTGDFGAAKTRPHTARRFAAAFACLALVVAGGTGYWAYFSPTCAISIDINPSVELGVNRFDKVVSVEGIGDDGEALAETLDIRFLDYADALDALLADPTVEGYLSQDEVLSIAVAGENEAQADAILAQAETCAAGTRNVYCHAADSAELEHAHEAGLSFGKYQTFLILQSLDPSVTAEDVQELTMRELHDRIAALDPDAALTLSGGYGHGSGAGNSYGAGNGTGTPSGNGAGNGNGTGQGAGAGNGAGNGAGSGSGNGNGSGNSHGHHGGH